jgi:hypothetical protein
VHSSDCPLFPVQRFLVKPLLSLDLFFNRWTSSPSQTNLVGWTLTKTLLQFLLPTLDRLLVQSSDLPEQAHSTMTDPVGFHSHIPTALLLIQPAYQQVHLLMLPFVWMFSQLLTGRTLASVNP